MSRRVLVFSVLVSFLFLSAPALAAKCGQGGIWNCSCGDTLVDSVTLNESMECNGTAINIDSSNIEFNCNGYTLTGNGTGYGAKIDNFNNTTVVNCRIRNFTTGIWLNEASNNTILSNKITRNSNTGIGVQYSSDTNNITGNNVNSNEYGISIAYASHGNIIKDNLVCNNSVIDIVLSDSVNNTGDNTCSNLNSGSNSVSCSWACTPSSCGADVKENSKLFTDYNCSGTALSIASDGVVLDCSGYTLTGNGTDYGVKVLGFNNTEVRDCVVDNFRAGILLHNANNSLVANNTGRNNSRGAIAIGGSDPSKCHDNSVVNNTVYNNNYYGIYVADSSNNTISSNRAWKNKYGVALLSATENNELLGNSEWNNTCGIYLEESHKNKVISEDIFENNVGIRLYNSSENNITSGNISKNINGAYLNSSSNNKFLSNNFSSNKQSALLLHSSTNNTISYNSFIDNKGGIKLSLSGYNELNSNNISDSNYYGIFVTDSSKNTISSNNVTRNSDGIMVESSDRNKISSNNLVSNNGTGIYLSRSSNNIISSNNATKNNNIGIYLFYSDNNTVSSNTAHDNENGVFLVSSSENLLSANSIYKNTWGTLLDNSSYNNISSNNASSNTEAGVALFSSSDYNYISSNTLSYDNSVGIYVENSSNNTATENLACSNQNSDIYLTSNTSGNEGDNACSSPGDNGVNNVTCTFDCGLKIGSDAVLQEDLKCLDTAVEISSDNVTFDCNGHAITGSGSGYGIDLTGHKNVTVRNCSVKGFKHGIFLDGSDNNTLQSNRVHENSDDGIHLEQGSENNNITSNTIFSNNGNGIYLNSSSDNTLSDNVACNNTDEDIQSYNSTGINGDNTCGSFDGPGSFTCSWNCTPDSCGGEITERSKAYRDYNCTGTGFHIGSNDTILDCNGYTITGNQTGYGVNVTDKNNVTAKNCIVRNFTTGIFVNNSENSLIFNSEVTSEGGGVTLGGSGIAILNTKNSFVENVTARNNTNEGIFVNSSENLTLSENKVLSSGDLGVYLGYTENTTLSKNYVYNSTGSGLYLYYSILNNITENSFLNNVYAGVHLNSSENNTLSTNRISENKYGLYSFGSNATDIEGNILCFNSNNDTYFRSNSVNNSGSNFFDTVYGGDNNTEFIQSESCHAYYCGNRVCEPEDGNCVADCNSNSNCGSYGNSCASDETCENGVCESADDGGDGGDGGSVSGGVFVPSSPGHSKSWDNITPRFGARMSINEAGNLGVKEITISVDNRVSNAKITVKKQEGRPADVSVNVSGRTYRYMNIQAENLNKSNLEEARIQFQANRSWIQENSINQSKVYLNRYTGEEWNRFSTSRISQTVDKVTYEARTPGFSYFAVSGEKKTEEVTKECLECQPCSDWSDCVNGTKARTCYRCSEKTNYTCQSYQEEENCIVNKTGEEGEQSKGLSPWTWKVLLIIAIAIVASCLYIKGNNEIPEEKSKDQEQS